MTRTYRPTKRELLIQCWAPVVWSRRETDGVRNAKYDALRRGEKVRLSAESIRSIVVGVEFETGTGYVWLNPDDTITEAPAP